MNHFSQILPPANVALDIDVSSKKRAFEQAGLLFENNCGIARSTVSDNLFAREPIPFESPDGEPVKLLIFLLIPDHVTQQHLEILSEVAEMFSDAAFRTMLATTADPLAVHARLITWQPSAQSIA